MPELPEVETMCREIKLLAGRRIRDLRRPRSKLQPILISPRIGNFRRRALGKRILAISRLGKRVVVELEGGDRIVFEPRMSGLVLAARPPDQEHLRLVFELSGRPKRQLLFWNQRGLGVVRLLSPRRFRQLCGPDKLGPDALDISAATLKQRLAGSRRAIKVALLDQRMLAGIGNLYASEILHRAGIHPELPCNELSAAAWKKLHSATRSVLDQAIRHQGSTLRDGTYRVGRNRPGGFQLLHRVYQRADQPCTQCGKADIVRIVQAQRSTFFCPLCQR